MRQYVGWWLVGAWLGMFVWPCGVMAQNQPPDATFRLARPRTVVQGFGNTLRTIWDDGLYLRTEGREVNLRVRGRLNLDVNGYAPSNAIEAAFGGGEARIFVRRVRLSLAGPVTKRIDFKLELDFAGREITFTDAYLRRQGGGSICRIDHTWQIQSTLRP